MGMSLPEPCPGLVIHYEYLWASEHDEGREVGSKARPCVVVVAVQREGGNTRVTVVPITHRSRRRGAVLLPPATKRRLGLDDEPSWVVCTEVNRFVWPGPDLRPLPHTGKWAYGLLPERLFEQVRLTLLAERKRQVLRVVPRTE
jgi:hypothetical protein